MTTTPPDVTLDQALAFRLQRQHLADPAEDWATAARALVGAQAQVHSAAILQLRARAPSTTAAAVTAAMVDSRSLVKLWAQRSTLHLALAADLPMILGLRRLFVPRYRRWLADSGLTDAQIDRLTAAIAEAVAEAPQSRAELAARLTPRLGDWAEPWLRHSWGGAVKLAATMGLVCHGPERPREATFVHLPDWVPAMAELDSADALARMARRYLASYGPARPRDFAKFTGVDAAAARAAFAAIAADTMPVRLGEVELRILAADEPALRTASFPDDPWAVLPHFDPYLLAHADTAQAVRPAHRALVYRTAGWISPVVLRRGRVAALWSAQARGTGWSVELRPLARIGKRDLRRIERRLAGLAGARGDRTVSLHVAGP